jgi:hypothetical protein
LNVRYFGAKATRRHFGGMPRADIKTKQGIYTLSQLHAELAGKFLENERQCVRLKTAMLQVEAVPLMLQPGFNIKSIARSAATSPIHGSRAARCLGAP